ncbi:MAG: MBL fold metallo-hydrolase [Dehalococcoidia bacterium]|nr:MBL fold metallo-hydrolase [Dehalococcoidia bacterium]
MIEIKALASSSAGNSIHVTDGRYPILLDAGISIDRIRKALDFQVSSLSGVLITHLHSDHSKSAKKLMEAGVDVFMSQPTAEALKLSGHRLHIVSDGQLFNVGTWAVKAFAVEHDVEVALGFFMASRGETVLYITDSGYVRQRFSGVNYLLIEANFDEQLIRENVAGGEVDRFVKRRTYATHMSINRVLDFLRANDMSQCREIWLLHLSDANSSEEEFKRKVQEATGIVTRIA